MNLKDQYHLAVLSNASIGNTETALARLKGQLLIELAVEIERKEAAAKAKAEADAAAEKPANETPEAT